VESKLCRIGDGQLPKRPIFAATQVDKLETP